MTYASERDALSRTPVTLVIVTMDYCAEVFGVAPCTGAGASCYNTFPTCKDKPNYNKTTKDYKFTSADAPLPFKTGERPYVASIDYNPTEIKTNLTVNARAKIKLYDEPELVDIEDPYHGTRTSIQGTYWKKWLARNPNYKGRVVKIYEGFTGLAEGDFTQTWRGIIDNISLSKDTITIEVVDEIRTLADIEVPTKDGIKLQTAMTTLTTAFTVDSIGSLMTTGGYVRLGDEIISYSTFSTVSKILSECARGAFATVPSCYSTGESVQPCRYFSPGNPFDHMMTILKTDAGISSDNINETTFTYFQSWPATDLNYSAIISEPTKLSDLFYELVELTDCHVWIAEDLKITIARNIGNAPSRAYSSWTDDANIIYGSGAVDLNEKSRITRTSLYYDKDAIGDYDKPNSYGRLAVAIDADAESSQEYNDVKEHKIFCRWLPSSVANSTALDIYAKSIVARRTKHYRDALPIVTVEVERKDSDAKVGTYVKLVTDEILDRDGSDSTGKYRIVYRDFTGPKAKYKLQKMPKRRVAFISNEATISTSYTVSSIVDSHKEYGFISSTLGEMSNFDDGYYIY